MEHKLYCWACRERAELRGAGQKNAECPACRHLFSCEELGAFEAGMHHIAGPLAEIVGEAAGKAAAACRRELVEKVARWLREHGWDDEFCAELDAGDGVNIDAPSPDKLADGIGKRFGTPEEKPEGQE